MSRRRRGIEVESVVTVDADCDMSCDVVDDQVEFWFAPVTDGLHFYFDWPGLAKCHPKDVGRLPTGAMMFQQVELLQRETCG